jgi:hypothetical protein
MRYSAGLTADMLLHGTRDTLLQSAKASGKGEGRFNASRKAQILLPLL